MSTRSSVLWSCFDAAVSAAGAEAAIHAHLRREGDILQVASCRIDLTSCDRVLVLAAGKAATGMARALEDIIAERLSLGCVVTKYQHGGQLRTAQIHEAAHPVPDAAGLAAAQALLQLAHSATERDLVIFALSGGASALLPAPRPGLSLADLQQCTELLLASGAAIEQVNATRKHLSTIAGGGLLRAAAPARVLTLAVSDVLGDDPASIGSGPSCADPSTFEQVFAICDEYHIWDRLTPAVRALLTAGVAGTEPETLKSGDPALAHAAYHVVASNAQALDAAEACAHKAGHPVRRIAAPLCGDAAAAGRAFADELLRCPVGTVLVAGGETTVVLPDGHGLGGRNQHFALAAAVTLAADPHGESAQVFAAGTDGTDGPTDAAGAVLDGRFWAGAQAAGHDPAGHLARCDAYPLLKHMDALVTTGATGTNVMDVAIGLRQ
ncbi:MAG: DUF4147 domain-containing protein [Planctomycetota bacterium]|jgi:glycerate 2-kinase|nr:DUF4147 domain-containing protein [Planctomycetota bacterium]